VKSGVVVTTYTLYATTEGTTYTFKVKARNEFGLSAFSASISILAAEVPAQAAAPTTSFSDTEVVIAWTEPDNMASAITSYHIYIRESDGITYSEEFTYCDGTDAVIIAAKSCTIPVSILRGSHYNLAWG
jgi:hypothetical protein